MPDRAWRSALGRTTSSAGGQRLDVRVDTGSEESNSRIAFREPAFLNRDLALDFSIFYQEVSRDGQNFDVQEFGFSTGLTFPVGEYSTLTLSYSLEESDLERRDENDPISAILARDATTPG